MDLQRKICIKNMQKSLKTICELLKLTSSELGSMIGVTGETILDIENNTTDMNVTQYIALCAVLDNMLKENVELKKRIIENVNSYSGVYMETDNSNSEQANTSTSFLERWFTMCGQEFWMNNHNAHLNMEDIDLEDVAKNYKIFLNYDSMMTEKSKKVFNQCERMMRLHNNKVIVPVRAVEVLKKLSQSTDADNLDGAQRGIELLEYLNDYGIIDVRGEKNDGEINNVIVSVFAKYRMNYKLILITQNEKLAYDVMQLNKNKSSEGHLIKAGYIDEYGVLRSYYSDEPWKKKVVSIIKENFDVKTDYNDDVMAGIDKSKNTILLEESKNAAFNEPVVVQGWDVIE